MDKRVGMEMGTSGSKEGLVPWLGQQHTQRQWGSSEAAVAVIERYIERLTI